MTAEAAALLESREDGSRARKGKNPSQTTKSHGCSANKIKQLKTYTQHLRKR